MERLVAVRTHSANAMGLTDGGKRARHKKGRTQFTNYRDEGSECTRIAYVGRASTRTLPSNSTTTTCLRIPLNTDKNTASWCRNPDAPAVFRPRHSAGVCSSPPPPRPLFSDYGSLPR